MEKNAWLKYSDEEIMELDALCSDYKEFISYNKTERECTKEIIERCERRGFKSLEYYLEQGKVQAGDKIYVNNMNKSVALFIIGSDDITNGMNILGSHIDSPRLDLKANPLYEEDGFAYFDTHYYGGIKKYQWVTIPLALHGVVVKKDGTVIDVVIGENKNDPVFGVTDLLPHLAEEQMKKEAKVVVEGEKLDVLIGSMPLKTDEEDKKEIEERILAILKEAYDIEKDDFLSAEIEVVPSGCARDFGLDRSMVMAYGQDDKVCAYTSLIAFLDARPTKKTLSAIFVDKEEIGSVGATGMSSMFYENALADICLLLGNDKPNAPRKVLSNSKMLSSDVDAAYDPLYADVMDKRNSSFFGHGMAFAKYTGARGKSGSNDANAEYIAQIRKMMDDNNISFQIAELGKVDAGGGGTIAYILANYNVEVIDCGVGVLNMHAPWEITSKADIYEAYKGYIVFLENA